MCEMEECLPQTSDFSLPPAGEELWSPILGCSLLEPFSPSFSHLFPFKSQIFWDGEGCYGVTYPTARLASSSDI